MRPEGKANADGQMGPRSVGDSGDTTGSTAGVNLTNEDKSGLPQGTGPASTPDTAAYTNLDNSKAVPINKSRGTGVQINNGALTAGQANPAGTGPAANDDGSGQGGAGASRSSGMGGGSTASEMAKVTSVSGDKVSGMNYGPSIGRFDNPPAVITRTGTPESVQDALGAIQDRWPGTDTEHRHPHPKDNDGTPTGLDRNWR